MSASLLSSSAASCAVPVASTSGSRRPQPPALAFRMAWAQSSRSSVRRSVALPRAYKVDLEMLDGTVEHLEVADGESVLDAATDKGLDIPWDCRMGVCLRCAAKVEDGQVDQGAGMLSDDVVEKGYALLCVSMPQSDCRVRVILEDELADEAMATSAAQQAKA